MGEARERERVRKRERKREFVKGVRERERVSIPDSPSN